MRNLTKIFMLILGLGLASGAHAQGDLAVLQSAIVPPNVVILFDTSASMNEVSFGDGFDPLIFWNVAAGGGPSVSDACDIGAVPEVDDSAGQCPGSRHLNDECPNIEVQDNSGSGSEAEDGDDFSCPLAVLPNGCGTYPFACNVSGGEVNFTLPSLGFATRWTRNYLHWFVSTASANGGQLFDIPGEARIVAAMSALTDLVNAVNPDDGAGGYEENVRFGLGVLHDVNGGYMTVPIGPNNKTQLMTGIGNLVNLADGGWTPISEALVDIGRYYLGSYDTLGSYGQYNRNTTGGTGGAVPGSPIDPLVPCRKNFILVITDGAPTEDLNNHHGTAFATTIGDYDADGNDALIGPVDATNYLDDVALYLYENDLIADGVMTGKQNIITYTIGFSVDLTLLADTALNGNGEYFTTATSGQLTAHLTAALADIIERATSFSAATVPTSRTAFGDGFYTAFFHPRNDSGFWPGHLEAYRVAPDLTILDKNGNPAIDPLTNQFIEPRQPFWDAQDVLSGAGHPVRKLYTTKTGLRTDFTPATITAADLGVTASDLTLYPNYPTVSFATTEALADGLVSYLDGSDVFDDDTDGNLVEKRVELLGDIFHSGPLSIGPPPLALSQEPGFGPITNASSFLGRYSQRDRRLYVGANDGMLHAFEGGKFNNGDNLATPELENGYYDLGTGREAFGYVPGSLLDTIKFIPRNVPRQYWYVDGSPVAADAWLPSGSGDVTKDPLEWATVMITPMRDGGASYLALDVTDPGATTGPHGPYPKLLWEIDDTDLDIGLTWSEPVIARVKIKTGSLDFCGLSTMDDGPCREQWVAIFGGGYRADGDPNLVSYISDPNSVAWSTKSKGIFMVAIDTGEVLASAVYDTDPTKMLNQMRYSIPSDPAVLDLDFDGFADVVYIGDLGGQVWRWDISTVGVPTDHDSNAATPKIVEDWPTGLLFKSDPAPLSGGGFHYHSIFFPPVATFLNGELVLGLGSGERTDLTYIGNAGDDDENRFWVIWDRTPLGLDPEAAATNWVTLGEGYTIVNGFTRGLNDVSALATDPAPDDDGYFIKLPDGEKFITKHVIFGGILLTLSFTPGSSGASLCDNAGTTNLWLFYMDDAGGLMDQSAAAGNAQRTAYLGPGAPTNPQIVVTKDKVVLIGQTSLGSVFEFDIPTDPPPPLLRTFWRQLF